MYYNFLRLNSFLLFVMVNQQIQIRQLYKIIEWNNFIIKDNSFIEMEY
jgi:hypothetical protein